MPRQSQGQGRSPRQPQIKSSKYGGGFSGSKPKRPGAKAGKFQDARFHKDRKDKKPFDKPQRKMFDEGFGRNRVVGDDEKESSDEMKKTFFKKPVHNPYRGEAGSVPDPKKKILKPLKKPKAEKKPSPNAKFGERLQKILASAGYGSRRGCEELILQGRVKVDGKVVTELGTRANPFSQEIRVDGERIRQAQKIYLAMNKPKGCICAVEDARGDKLIIDYLPPHLKDKVYPVGRLDKDTSGLIFLTNDGDFANRVIHPSNNVEKIYQARVRDMLSQEQLDRLVQGMHLEDGFAKAEWVKQVARVDDIAVLDICVKEGRNRMVRRMLELLGLNLRKLKRIAIGPIRLGNLEVGQCREMEPREVGIFKG